MKICSLVPMLVPLAGSLALGCATTTDGALDRTGPSRRGPEVSLDDARSPDDATPTFPRRLTSPSLPGVDRIAHRVEVEHGGALEARLRICVRPDGAVAAAELVDTSGMAEFDAAVVAMGDGLVYEPYAAPDHVSVCQLVTVAYRAP